MSADTIVQKYSQALFEATQASNNATAVASELAQLAPIFTEDNNKIFFSSPFNSTDTKLMVAKSTLEGKCLPETFNFLITVVEKERIAFLTEITKAYETLVRAQGGETEGVLFVSSDVSDDFRSQVETKISAALNKKVKLNVEKDVSLISGYKVSVGSWTMDDSAKYHLNKIKDDILKRGI